MTARGQFHQVRPLRGGEGRVQGHTVVDQCMSERPERFHLRIDAGVQGVAIGVLGAPGGEQVGAQSPS